VTWRLDDHDFGGNNVIGGPEVDTPAWKQDVVFKIFKVLRASHLKHV